MSRKQPYDASNPEHIAKAQEAADIAADNFRAVLNLKQGRAFLHGLIFGDCRVGAPSFGSRGDETAFREGQRDIGIKLNEAAKAVDRDLYMLMLKENFQ